MTEVVNMSLYLFFVGYIKKRSLLNILKMMIIIFLSVEKEFFVYEKTFNILQQNLYKNVFEFTNENEQAIDIEEYCDTSCGC